jgi:hypothetical protein
MNPTVQAALARNLAQLQRVRKDPVAPFGYGVDLSCITDCDSRFSTVDPFSAIGIGQACARRLLTPVGSLLGSPDYGYDLAGLLNRGVTPGVLSTLAMQVQNQCELDDRVQRCAVRLTLTGTAIQPELTVRLTITPEDYNVGTFRFVFALSADTISILESPG